MLWPKSETLRDAAHSVRKWIKIYLKHYKRLANERFKRTERYGGKEISGVLWQADIMKTLTEAARLAENKRK